MLLRGSCLKNTEYIYGIVIYVGHDTKMMRNASTSRVKISRNEKMLNRQILYIFCLQICLCVFGAVYGTLWERAKLPDNL
jgi:phospholipid-transporting ATPase